jgi:hypothetical protein
MWCVQEYCDMHKYLYFIFEIRFIIKVTCKHSNIYYLEYKDACLCLTVCGLGTSTNSHPSPQFGCSNTQSNIQFTYRHSNCSRRLLPAPQQCGCFSLVGRLIEHFREEALHAQGHIFSHEHLTGGIVLCLFHCNCKLVVSYDTRTSFRRLTLNLLTKIIVILIFLS